MAGERIRTYRQAHGWSARELADRCRDAGLTKWNREVVTNLELGRRAAFSIDELLVVAYVLGVPPTALFIPLGDSDEFLVTPNLTTHPWQVYQWISGTRIEPRPGNQGLWSRKVNVTNKFRKNRAGAIHPTTQHQFLETAIANYQSSVREHGDVISASDTSLYILTRAINEMIDEGILVPPLPVDVVEAIRDRVSDPESLRIVDPDNTQEDDI